MNLPAYEHLLPLLKPLIFALFASAAVLTILLRTGLAWTLATDTPNARSLHTRITPRMGGLAIVPLAVVAMYLAAPSFKWLAIGTGVLAVTSYIDDRRGLPVTYRLAVQIAAAVLLLFAYPLVPANWALGWQVLWAIGLVLSCVWTTNAYNFIDGANGLAGGGAICGFAAYAVAAVATQPELALVSTVLVGATLGFLPFNFPHARLFLGDVGSITLGYLVSALGLLGWSYKAWPLWFPLFVFLPFVLDTAVTFLRRLRRGDTVWQAHCEHYYQRMIRMGWGHQRTTLIWYGLISLNTLLALLCFFSPSLTRLMMGAIWLVGLIGLGVYVDRCWSKFSRTHCVEPQKSHKASA